MQPPESDETEDDSYEEVRRRSKQYRKKIKYEDAIDGIPDYEDEQEDENEQEEDEIELKKQSIKKKYNQKKKKKRNYRVNKYVNFYNFSSFCFRFHSKCKKLYQIKFNWARLLIQQTIMEAFHQLMSKKVWKI